MIRGESPQQFLQNLAKTEPRLNGLDLQNPDKTARKLCEENGEDYDKASRAVMDTINQSLAK